jgi:pyruvoyl-dependent arginine decarboxylase (PvlArgDC)
LASYGLDAGLTHRVPTAAFPYARPADQREQRLGTSLRSLTSEHHGYGKDEVESGDYAEDLTATMLASTLGIEFDPDALRGTSVDVFMRRAT